jgi:ubiquinone/menaquinone biosynthesis C-methylase UbiE
MVPSPREPASSLVLDAGDIGKARRGVWRSIVAFLAARGAAGYEREVAARKHSLLSGLGGRVLEIGPGAGANLPYFGREVDWIGVEPSLPMQAQLLSRAAAHRVRGRVVTGTSEHLPAADASIDAVVSTLVLCSVSDVAGALAEVRRVLRPGGQFVFIEHVAAPSGTRLRKRQDFWRPLWVRLADGCRPNQDTARLLEQAGFSSVRAEPFEFGKGLLSPHIAGVAIR